MATTHAIGAVILAAGKGKRMQATTINKVAYQLAGKAMIVHAVDLLEQVGISPIVVVVGFAKESIIDLLSDRVRFAYQDEQLGTGHALQCGLKELPDIIEHILVVNGDDAAFYPADLVQNLLNVHLQSQSAITFLTVDIDRPQGLGRVVRDKEGKVIKIVEEKDATEKEREIHEINAACYLISMDFLKKYGNNIPKSEVTGEYYVVSLVEIAVSHGEKVETVKGGHLPWRGVNTQEELALAEELFAKRRQVTDNL